MPPKNKPDATSRREAHAGLAFSVSRTENFIRANYKGRVTSSGPVAFAALLEYIAAEIVELAGEAAKANKFKRIKPRHVMLAIKNDEELNKLCQGMNITHGGVIPHIHSEF